MYYKMTFFLDCTGLNCNPVNGVNLNACIFRIVSGFLILSVFHIAVDVIFSMCQLLNFKPMAYLENITIFVTITTTPPPPLPTPPPPYSFMFMALSFDLGTENCVVTDTDSEWRDYYCNIERTVLCQVIEPNRGKC